MTLSRSRLGRVLNLVAEHYINTARPVPSSLIAGRLQVSSATVRNDFATLEADEYLQQQHVSSGRIPTVKGLREYARRFIPPRRLPERQQAAINDRLELLHGESLFGDLARMAAELSGYAVVVQLPRPASLRLRQVHLSPAGDRKLLAVFLLEDGLVHQRLIPLESPPHDGDIGEAESILRQLDLPVGAMREALSSLASGRSPGVAQLLDAVAAVLPEVLTPRIYTHGLANLFHEPEAADPDFLRQAARRVEQPVEPGSGLGVLLDESTAVLRASFRRGTVVAELQLVGPARMRYREATRLANGLVTALERG